MSKRAAVLLFAFVVLISLPAVFAQTTNSIQVQLEGCYSVQNVWMVFRGDDLAAIELRHVGDLWVVDRARSFDASEVRASLRFHPGRTTCRRPLPDQVDTRSGNPIALFVFRCAEGDYRRIEFHTGDVSIAYKRHLDESAALNDVECDESGEFLHGHGTITDVNAYSEKIFIYPAMASADVSGPGILISNLAKTPHALVKKFSRAQLSNLFAEQAATGNASSPPVLSDNWRLRMQMGLEKLGVNDVSISVRR